MSPPPLSYEAAAIVARLRLEGIDYLYHWTSVENLPGIRDMGSLCSKQILKDHYSMWLSKVEPGGNQQSHELDERLGNYDKLALNFTPHTPMVFNRKKDIGNQICFFIIKAEVAAWQGVMFTRTNAASPLCLRDCGMVGLSLVDFAAVKAPPFGVDAWVELVQAEVLVPDRITLDHVEMVVFVSEASCREAERLWGLSPHPSFEVAREYFASSFHDTSSISFPYLDKFYIVDGDSGEHFTENPVNFFREPVRDIYVEAYVQAQTGTELRMELQPVGRKAKAQYPRRGRYRSRRTLSTGSLSTGAYSVECYLDNIRWARLDFKLTD
jgi:hypothetical protein